VVARLEEFPLSRIEHASGKLVTQYRGQILPLVYVTQVIDPGSAITADQRDPMQVVVFADGTHMVGAIVDQVIDIVDDVVTVRQPTAQHGLVGSAVVAQKVTDFLDVHAVIATAQQDWFAHVSASGSHRTVMLAEHSAFLRGILRTHLEMAGHRVVEVASESEAMDRLERTPVDLVVADLDLAGDGAAGLLRQMRSSTRLAGIPALGLGTRGTNGHGTPPGLCFDEYQSKGDHAAMLAAIERMVEAAHAPESVPELVG
jgi:two-component system chemotaxis sensor kinase CheA